MYMKAAVAVANEAKGLGAVSAMAGDVLIILGMATKNEQGAAMEGSMKKRENNPGTRMMIRRSIYPSTCCNLLARAVYMHAYRHVCRNAHGHVYRP